MVILSGMSDMQQLEANCKTFETFAPTTPTENAVLYDIAESLKTGVPCTACRYCTKSCPMELDIPRLLYLYNEFKFTDGGFLAKLALSAVAEDKQPSTCISCGKCVELCPQKIAVPDVFAEFVEKLAE